MWKTEPGSTGRLLQLCIGYFVFYVVTGIAVKYFTQIPVSPPELASDAKSEGAERKPAPRMTDMEYLVWSTLGGSFICLGVVLTCRWFQIQTTGHAQLGPLRFPHELYYIIPSGVCTAVVIPTTTLMYTLGISVMVAMVIMRGSIIIVSRIVDAIQISRGILQKKVYLTEDFGVVFAALAVATQVFWAKEGDFTFFRSQVAMTILGAYVVAYAIRLYIMNYYKNTRPKGTRLDNRGFFGIEQIAASITLLGVCALVFLVSDRLAGSVRQIDGFASALRSPSPAWHWAALSGTAFGMVAFFSVFLFMFQGRTATFAGLVNRLTSLIAGTTATLLLWGLWNQKAPKPADWLSLGFILVAIGLLSSAEKRRVRELRAAHEIDGLATTPAPPQKLATSPSTS